MPTETGDRYQDPDDSPNRLDRWQLQRDREVADRQLADGDHDTAVRDAVRSEQLSRDADHARHVAETTDDPVVQRQALAWAHEDSQQARVMESDAWAGFRAAGSGYADASADAVRTLAEEVPAGPEYDTRQRRDEWAEQLESRGIDHEVVASRVRADIGHAKPATAVNRQRSARSQTLRGETPTARRRPQHTQRAGRHR